MHVKIYYVACLRAGQTFVQVRPGISCTIFRSGQMAMNDIKKERSIMFREVPSYLGLCEDFLLQLLCYAGAFRLWHRRWSPLTGCTKRRRNWSNTWNYKCVKKLKEPPLFIWTSTHSYQWSSLSLVQTRDDKTGTGHHCSPMQIRHTFFVAGIFPLGEKANACKSLHAYLFLRTILENFRAHLR